MTPKVECVWPLAAELGEGPIWSLRERAVWFVDIKGRHIHRFDERSGLGQSWHAPEAVGFVVPATNGRLLCGLKSGLHAFDRDRGTFERIVLVDADYPENRLNDAFVDATGRLWFGTMDDAEHRQTGSLYRFDKRGLECCDRGYVITNGPVVSPDGRTLYHVNTLERTVYAFDLDAQGEISNRRLFVRIELVGAYPDGPSVDSAGCVWIALYGGRGVQRYSPEGRLLETIELPVSNCTKAVFGGDDLRTLYITTAWKDLSDEQRSREPLAGGLFRVRVDTPGLPQGEVLHEF